MRLGARNRSAQSITYSARGRGYASTTSRYQWTRPRVFLERSTCCPSFSLEVEPQGHLILMRFQKIDFANANERSRFALSVPPPFLLLHVIDVNSAWQLKLGIYTYICIDTLSASEGKSISKRAETSNVEI